MQDSGSDDKTQSHVQLARGSEIGHYRIIEKIGAGGMGEVYVAEDIELNRKVALKFLPPHLCQDAGCRARFKREAQAAAKLSHPNIITIYEVSDYQGRPFFAMEFVEGRSLKEHVAGRDLSDQQIIDLALQVCEGLAAAHESGVIHRDIKPSNILIDSHGRTKIVDFGLAAVKGADQLTKTGSTMGTLGYMSPEQARGENVDHRSDLFSFGIVLYELISGKTPFAGESEAATLKNVVDKDPEPLARYKSSVPEELQRIIDKVLSKDRKLRYQHADDLLVDLKGVCRQSVSQVPAKQPSIAVLPFANLSADKEQEYFCDGMAEEIINALSQIAGLRVVARTSAFAFKDRHEDVREIGRILNVDNLLEGSVRQSGKRLRITAQLVKVSDGYHLWSERYDREMEDIFSIQDDISLSIVGQLKGALFGKERATSAGRHTRDVEAYNLYLQGRFFWNKRTESGIQRGLEYFLQATERDPAYGLAYAASADCYNLLGWYGVTSPKEAFPRAKSAAERALAIDGNLSEALTSHAYATMLYEWRWEEAEREFKRGIKLNPGYATGHHWYSEYLVCMGRMEAALTETNQALEFDPLSLIIRTSRGVVLYFSDQYDEAINHCKGVLEMDQSFVPAHYSLGLIYTMKSMCDEAISEFQIATALFGRSSLMQGALGHAYAVCGKQEEARKVITELTQVSEPMCVPYCYIAAIYADLGDKEEAFKWLTRAVTEHDAWIMFLKVDPIWRNLRSDPRFGQLLRGMGLEQ